MRIGKILIVVLLVLPIFAQELTVEKITPYGYSLYKEDLATVLIISGMDTTAKIRTKATKDDNEFVASIVTEQFRINKGTNMFSPGAQPAIDSFKVADKYKGLFDETGMLPDGHYTILIEVEIGGEVAGSDILIHDVNYFDVVLISPLFEYEVTRADPLFSWVATSPISGLGYTLSIWEVDRNFDRLGFQPGESFYRRDGLTSNSFQYPANAPRFKYGGRYFWKINVLVNGTLVAESDIFEFTNSYKPSKDSSIVSDTVSTSEKEEQPETMKANLTFLVDQVCKVQKADATKLTELLDEYKDLLMQRDSIWGIKATIEDFKEKLQYLKNKSLQQIRIDYRTLNTMNSEDENCATDWKIHFYNTFISRTPSHISEFNYNYLLSTYEESFLDCKNSKLNTLNKRTKILEGYFDGLIIDLQQIAPDIDQQLADLENAVNTKRREIDRQFKKLRDNLCNMNLLWQKLIAYVKKNPKCQDIKFRGKFNLLSIDFAKLNICHTNLYRLLQYWKCDVRYPEDLENLEEVARNYFDIENFHSKLEELARLNLQFHKILNNYSGESSVLSFANNCCESPYEISIGKYNLVKPIRPYNDDKIYVDLYSLSTNAVIPIPSDLEKFAIDEAYREKYRTEIERLYDELSGVREQMNILLEHIHNGHVITDVDGRSILTSEEKGFADPIAVRIHGKAKAIAKQQQSIDDLLMLVDDFIYKMRNCYDYSKESDYKGQFRSAYYKCFEFGNKLDELDSQYEDYIKWFKEHSNIETPRKDSLKRVLRVMETKVVGMNKRFSNIKRNMEIAKDNLNTMFSIGTVKDETLSRESDEIKLILDNELTDIQRALERLGGVQEEILEGLRIINEKKIRIIESLIIRLNQCRSPELVASYVDIRRVSKTIKERKQEKENFLMEFHNNIDSISDMIEFQNNRIDSLNLYIYALEGEINDLDNKVYWESHRLSKLSKNLDIAQKIGEMSGYLELLSEYYNQKKAKRPIHFDTEYLRYMRKQFSEDENTWKDPNRIFGKLPQLFEHREMLNQIRMLIETLETRKTTLDERIRTYNKIEELTSELAKYLSGIEILISYHVDSYNRAFTEIDAPKFSKIAENKLKVDRYMADFICYNSDNDKTLEQITSAEWEKFISKENIIITESNKAIIEGRVKPYFQAKIDLCYLKCFLMSAIR